MKLLAIAAVAEAATGLALVVVPSLVGQVLLGTDLSGVSIPVARVAGIALIAPGVSCWPRCRPLDGMLIYSLLVTLYFIWLGHNGEWVGILLWPAIAAHALLTAFLIHALLARDRRTSTVPEPTSGSTVRGEAPVSRHSTLPDSDAGNGNGAEE